MYQLHNTFGAEAEKTVKLINDKGGVMDRTEEVGKIGK